MKFGQVPNPHEIDFTLPESDSNTKKILAKSKKSSFEIAVGCAKWNKADLKNFYPRGTKNELEYYATQFNSIELNATFYRNFPTETVEKWYSVTPDDFKFFPKIMQRISHLKRLNHEQEDLDNCLNSLVHLKEKLGTIFLQMHNNFAPKDFDRVIHFIEHWPKEFQLAVEFRHTDWYNDASIAQELYELLEENNVTNVLVDTAGRRDLLHMRLTNTEAFVRYVGANHASDYARLDDWIDRVVEWKAHGLEKLHFFIHQNVEEASPLLSAYFIKKLNATLGTQIHVPKTLNDTNNNPKLF